MPLVRRKQLRLVFILILNLTTVGCTSLEGREWDSQEGRFPQRNSSQPAHWDWAWGHLHCWQWRGACSPPLPVWKLRGERLGRKHSSRHSGLVRVSVSPFSSFSPNKTLFYHSHCSWAWIFMAVRQRTPSLAELRKSPATPALWEAEVSRSPEVRSSRPAWPTCRNPVSTKNTKKLFICFRHCCSKIIPSFYNWSYLLKHLLFVFIQESFLISLQRACFLIGK